MQNYGISTKTESARLCFRLHLTLEPLGETFSTHIRGELTLLVLNVKQLWQLVSTEKKAIRVGGSSADGKFKIKKSTTSNAQNIINQLKAIELTSVFYLLPEVVSS